jgi:antitoxin component of MazEF toxin-antitoxin module
MNTINTTLTTSGNSVAVRLPKDLLRMSGLSDKVTLEARRGKIIISKISNPREGWSKQIKSLVAKGDPSQEFADLTVVASDGLDLLPWDGPTFEEWQQDNAKLS